MTNKKKLVQQNIMMPKKLKEAMDKEADKLNISTAEWMRRVCEERLGVCPTCGRS